MFEKKVMAGWAAFMRSENNQADVSDEAWMHLPEKVRAGWWSAIRAVTQKDAQPEQSAAQSEPVGEVHINHINGMSSVHLYGIRTLHHGDKLYTHPQQASKPMTDEQIRALCKHGWTFETVRQWVKVVERFHKIGGE